MMKGAIDECNNKEISPMFPRLHVKDAEKGGPKAPPRNKMALYEQFSIPSQSFASGSAPSSLFPLPLRVPSISTSHIGSNQSIQLRASNAPSIIAEKIQDYNSRKINLPKLMQGNFIGSKNSSKTFNGEDLFITSGSVHGKNSCLSLVENDKDGDKLADCNSSCSFKSLNSFRKKVNSLGTVELKSAQYRKNHKEEHSEVIQIGQKPEEGSAHTLDGFGDAAEASLNSLAKGWNSKTMKKESRSLNEEVKSISADSLKTLQGSSIAQTHKENATFGDKMDLSDTERLAASDGLEIGERCLLGKRTRNTDEETYKHYDALCDISPDNVLGVIGEKQFWKARKTIINQQRIFFFQVFELHRLIEVQRLIAGSPHLLLEDNTLLNKTPLKPPAFKKLHSDYSGEQPSSVVKLDSKSENPATAEHVKNNAVSKIPLPNFVSNTSKSHFNQLPSFGHHLGNPAALAPLDINVAKQPSSCVYPPPPPGNQWLVPVMSPSEGLVYKPIVGPCPPNVGFMSPLYGGACGTMNFNPGSKDISDTSLFPSSHQKVGTLYGSSLPQFLPTLMHPSVSAPAFEQMGQSNGPENRHSPGEVNSSALYKSLSNISCQTSQIRNITTYHHSSKDKEVQRSTATSPSKITKGDVLPLFPVAPTLWPSIEHRDTRADHQPRVIKALPHNPKSATESAARIFRSIQEERKNV